MRKHRLVSTEAAFGDETPINLTPLIDVVFVVLIMFIIVAPMLELDRVQLASAPIKDTEQVILLPENNPITLHVHADNSIWLNGQAISLQALLPALQRVKQQHPTITPQIFHDKTAHFGTYQSVKNALEQAGFEQMDLILQPN